MKATAGQGSLGRLAPFVVVAGVLAALYFGRDVLIPLALSGLLVFVLGPMVRRFESIGLPRVAAVVVVSIVSLTPVALVAWMASTQFVQMAERLPEYKDDLARKIESIRGAGPSVMKKASDALEELDAKAAGIDEKDAPSEPVKVSVVEGKRGTVAALRGIFGPLVEPLAKAGIVIVLVFFFLIHREDLRDRLIRLISRGRMTVTTSAMDEAGRRISTYLRAQVLVNLVNGVVVGIALALIGVPGAFMFGLVSVLLRFIPYVGPIVAVGAPIAVAAAVGPDWTMALVTAAVLLADELILSNIVEPWVYGKGTGVSTVGLLVAMLFWTWLWGLPGLLLAAPLTVCLVVAGKFVPQMSFLNVLLGTDPAVSAPARVYQRLLASDYEEASEVVRARMKDRTLVQTLDEAVLPALVSLGDDTGAGDLEEERRRRVLRAMRSLVEETAHAAKKPEAGAAPVAPAGGARRILCVPARDEADAVAARMLEIALADAGHEARALSLDDLGSDVKSIIDEHKPDAIFVSASPPFASSEASVRCRLLRRKEPKAPIFVGLWASAEDGGRAAERLGASGAQGVVTTLAQAVAMAGAAARTQV